MVHEHLLMNSSTTPDQIGPERVKSAFATFAIFADLRFKERKEHARKAKYMRLTIELKSRLVGNSDL